MINKKNLYNILFYLLLIFPFFEITYLKTISSFYSKFNNLLLVFSGFIIIILTIKNGLLSKINQSIFIYLLFLLIVTLLNNANLNGCLVLIYKTSILCLIVDYGLNKNTKAFLNAFEFLLTIYIFINFLTILLYPEGMYITGTIRTAIYTQNWLLGYKNLHILYILPAIMVSCINSFYSQGKISFRSWILIIISCLSLILANSSTSLIGIFLILIFLVFQNFFYNKQIFNIYNLLKLYIVLFFSIVLFQIQNLFSTIITNLFHKNITLTGRIYIWEYVIEFIKKKLLLGYGVEDTMVRFFKTSSYRSTHAHNQILEIIYKSGLIGLLLFLRIIYISAKQLMLYKNEKVSKFLTIVLFSLFIMMLTEAYSFEMIMYLFVFAYNVKYLIHKMA